jgi:hypothetical protein
MMMMMMILMIFQTRFIRLKRNTMPGPVTEWLEKMTITDFQGKSEVRFHSFVQIRIFWPVAYKGGQPVRLYCG